MLMLLFQCFLEAGLLVFLLKSFIGEDVDLSTAFFIALGSSIGTILLVIGLASVIGLLGIALGDLIAALALGAVLSAMYGTEIKQSFMISGIFITCHAVLSFLLVAMFR